MDIKRYIEEEKKDFRSLKTAEPPKINSSPVQMSKINPVAITNNSVPLPQYSALPRPQLQPVDTKPSKLNLPGEGVFNKLKTVFSK